MGDALFGDVSRRPVFHSERLSGLYVRRGWDSFFLLLRDFLVIIEYPAFLSEW